MAKPIIVLADGAEASFDIVKIDRSKIYGSRKRVATDAQGNPCVRASLLADGSELLLPGMTAQGYFTETGKPVSRQEMVGLDENGNVVETQPSTLGVAQALEGPVDPAEVLGLDLDSVFYLEAVAGADGIGARLKGGDVFKFAFNYSAGLETGTAYLVGNDEGYFALAGARAAPEWVEEAAVFFAEESVTEDAGDLDFDDL
jgi:hypothetical protein